MVQIITDIKLEYDKTVRYTTNKGYTWYDSEQRFKVNDKVEISFLFGMTKVKKIN